MISGEVYFILNFVTLMKNNRYQKASLPLIASIAVLFGLFLGKFVYQSTHLGFQLDLTSSPASNKIQRMLNLINNHYVDSVAYATIEEEIIQSMLNHLDPHSSYMSPLENKIEQGRMEGEFGGVGIKFRMLKDTILVLKTINNGPADKAGILPGDKITKVDGELFVGPEIGLDIIVESLRGKEGSKLQVQVWRDTVAIDFVLQRELVALKSVEYVDYITDSILYVKIIRFSKKTFSEFKAASEKVQANDLKGIIIDLRGNPGGYMDQVIKLCDEFLPNGKLIVFTKDKYERDETFATKKGQFQQVPLVVLIDEKSASASEIFAGAMQDNDRGLIIGRRSFGKGLVQRPFEFSDGSVLRLTISRYYTPVGRSIQKPYGENKQAYKDEIHDRIVKGELYNADSMSFPDSLKFITPKGKLVYGGGGVFPDIFIPADSVGYENFLLDIYHNALIELFVLNELKTLNKIIGINSIASDFELLRTLGLFEKFMLFLPTQGIKNLPKEVNTLVKKRLHQEILAEILEHFYEERGKMYPFLQKDTGVTKALESLKKPN